VTRSWKPKVDLYDGDVFIEQVPSNAIVYEVNGRTDWGFNATDNDVGVCWEGKAHEVARSAAASQFYDAVRDAGAHLCPRIHIDSLV